MVTMKKVDHQEWLRRRGLLPTQIKAKKKVSSSWRREYSDSLKVDRSTAHYDSASLSGKVSPCPNRSIMANLHKESEATRAAILEKASRVMPLYNKGGLQVLSKSDDLKALNKVSRS